MNFIDYSLIGMMYTMEVMAKGVIVVLCNYYQQVEVGTPVLCYMTVASKTI